MLPLPDELWRSSWDALRFRARFYLEHSAQLPPSVSRGQLFHGIPRLRLWCEPGGLIENHDVTSLTVFELFTDDWTQREPVVREVIWHTTIDLEKVRKALAQAGKLVTLPPSLSVRDAAIPAPQFHALLAEASQMRVPITWFQDSESVTSDASDFGFAFYSRNQPPAVLRLEWSFDVPPAWEPVVAWYWRMREFLEGCLREKL
jgi:hypothetical protein